MGLIEYETSEKMTREQAAAKLRELADQLARHNQVNFERDGLKYTVEVPDEVTLAYEVEVGEESEIEIEIKW